MVKKIPKLTTDNPQNNFEMALNFTDIGEDGWVWMRQPERTLVEYMRTLVKAHGSDIDVNGDDYVVGEDLDDHLLDGPETIDGLLAEHYTILWAYATLREKLKWYEEAGIPAIPPDGLKTIRRAVNRGTSSQLELACEDMADLIRLVCRYERRLKTALNETEELRSLRDSIRDKTASVYIALACVVDVFGKPEDIQQAVAKKLDDCKNTM